MRIGKAPLPTLGGLLKFERQRGGGDHALRVLVRGDLNSAAVTISMLISIVGSLISEPKWIAGKNVVGLANSGAFAIVSCFSPLLSRGSCHAERQAIPRQGDVIFECGPRQFKLAPAKAEVTVREHDNLVDISAAPVNPQPRDGSE
jgi:hypothetical protein